MILGKQATKLENLYNFEYQCLSHGISPIDCNSPYAQNNFSTSDLDLSQLMHIQGVSQSLWITKDHINDLDSFNGLNLPISSILGKYCLLSSAYNPNALISSVKALNIDHADDSWVLEYQLVSPWKFAQDSQDNNNPSSYRRISSRSLCCALSQQISGRPSLTERTVPYSYSIFELDSGFYFGMKIHEDLSSSYFDSLVDIWKNRPFVFSGASSLAMTESVCNSLVHLVALAQGKSVKDITLLDPCCGGGTFALSSVR